MSAVLNQQINLYQPIFRKPRKVFSVRTMVQAAGIVLLALILLYGWAVWQTHQLHNRLVAMQGQQAHDSEVLSRLEATLAKRRPSAALTQALAAAESERDAREALLKALTAPHRANTTGFAPALEGLARTPVDGLWLTGITLADGGDQIQLTGATTRSTQVPKLVRDLADAPAFAGVEFKRLQIERDTSKSGPGRLDFVLSTTAEKAKP
ncbi:MAG TPA: PilN domain-containing protein [Gammaproteobacteria bacterium]|nr:PilN domain-containing protein [Gammaproteobacteria bacterium]